MDKSYKKQSANSFSGINVTPEAADQKMKTPLNLVLEALREEKYNNYLSPAKKRGLRKPNTGCT